MTFCTDCAKNNQKYFAEKIAGENHINKNKKRETAFTVPLQKINRQITSKKWVKPVKPAH